MSPRKSAVSLLAVGIFLFTMAGVPSARADGTCSAFLAAKLREAQSKNQVYKIELFIHREETKLVTYSAGFLQPNAKDGSFTGRANQLFSDRQPGTQPFYVRGLTLPNGTVHNIVYAATQENVVHAFDTNSFVQLWSVSLGPAVPAGEVDCQNNINPLVGITSTPVISLERSTIYVVAK